MSMYNLMCGNNPLFTLLHKIIEVKGNLPNPIPRYRDTYTMREEDGTIRIVIYTRTGGGNRQDHTTENEAMRNHQLFVRDFDDTFDETFNNFVYAVPEEWKERVDKFHDLFSRHPKGMSPRQKFDSVMAGLKNEEWEKPTQLTQEEILSLSELIENMASELGLIRNPHPENRYEPQTVYANEREGRTTSG